MFGQNNPDWEVVFHPDRSLRKLYIELTNRCNLSCGMCYRQGWKDTEGEMDEEIFSRLLAEITKFPHLEEIVLGGLGEPLYHSRFWDCLSRLHDTFPHGKITLTTNGLLLHLNSIKRLARLGIARVVVSVDGAETAVQQRVRGVEAGDVSTKLLELGAIIRETPGITWWWEMVWQQKNRDQLPELIKLAARCHVETLVISHLMATSPEMAGEALYDPVLSPEDQNLLTRSGNLALLCGLSLQLPKHRPVTERRCAFVEGHSTVIGWDGSVSPCYRYLHGGREYFYRRAKDVPRFHFGRLGKKSLDQIWNQKDYLQFRYRVANSLYPSCPDCDFVDGCDVVNRSEGDCDGGLPACGDCLWSRGIVQCP